MKMREKEPSQWGMLELSSVPIKPANALFLWKGMHSAHTWCGRSEPSSRNLSATSDFCCQAWEFSEAGLLKFQPRRCGWGRLAQCAREDFGGRD
jgi:hypothetical protein